MAPQSIINEPIAIIGIGCRFPGASSLSKLKELLPTPNDLSQDIPDDRFHVDGFYHPNAQNHGSTSVRRSYCLDVNVREFDNNFFNITAIEATAMDPQQRLLLETVYEALENANVSVKQLKGSDTGVYVGLMCGDYENILMRDIDSAPRYQVGPLHVSPTESNLDSLLNFLLTGHRCWPEHYGEPHFLYMGPSRSIHDHRHSLLF